MHIDARFLNALLRLFLEDPKQKMEGAKKLIALSKGVDEVLLLRIATNRGYDDWTRTAATYALGLVGSRQSVTKLITILDTSDESNQVKSHAAEALGNLRSKKAVHALERLLQDPEVAADVKRSAAYALSEVGGK